jgi:hypothetical protein
MKYWGIISGLIFFYASFLEGSELAYGEQTVRKAIAMTTTLLSDTPLPDISIFLYRVATVESRWGEDPRTYRSGYWGGIWQVDRVAFEDSQDGDSHPSLLEWYRRLRARANTLGMLELDWVRLSWEDCVSPLVSCLAARLYLATIPEPVPDSLEAQAVYWKKHYNKAQGKGTVEGFIRAVNSLERRLRRSSHSLVSEASVEEDGYLI